MKIKQLELKGFKSFKNRTVIRFGKGISSIVGPNGCGKSNVVDAFLWVMGETAPKHLRGSSMEDLIFTGTGKQPASGVAEVSLVMEAKTPNVFPSPYKECEEIMVTRRLDRDGKSDYLINSRPCRLKDVQEIFMDTGAGIHGFSFIEQGAVERFISSKPEQKRLLIESAAGISKFRSRKKEAERKLELTDVNLKRLKDILSQQNTQLEKLKKQSEKAEQFRNLRQQIREKDVQISRWDLNHIQKEKQSLDKQIEEEKQNNEDRKKELAHTGSNSDELKKIYEEKKVQEKKIETDMDSIKVQFLSLEKELAGLKASIQVNKQDISHQDFQSYKKNRQTFLSHMEDSENQIVQLEKKQKDLHEQWEWVKQEYEKLNKKLSASDMKKQSLETELMNCVHQEALSRERDQSIVEKIRDWDQNEKELKILLQEKNKVIQKLQSQKKLMMEDLERKKQLSFNVTGSAQELEKEVESFKKDIQVQESHLKKMQEEASALYSEWNSLKKLGSRIDAQEKGIQFVLQSTEGKETFIETAASIRLLLPMLEKAVSSYLELRLKSVFCREEEAVLPALAMLNEKKSGRCRFILKNYQNSLATDEKHKKSLLKESGFQFFLKDQVEGSSELINFLFSSVAVVEDIQTALRLKKKYPNWCFLTLKGEALTQEGDLIGGEFVQDEMNILAYRRAIEEMPVQYEKMSSQIDLMEAQLKRTKTLFQKSSDKLSALSKEAGNFQISILEISKDLEGLSRDQNRLISEVSDIQKKTLECHDKRQELQKKRDHLQNELTISARKDALTQELKQAELECEKGEREKQTLSQQKNQLWTKVAGCEKEMASVKETRSLLKQSLESENREEKKFLSRSLEKKALIQTYEKKLQETEQQHNILCQKIQNTEKQLASLVGERESIREKISTEQSRIISLHQTLAEKESIISNLKLQSESLLLKKSSVVERIMERYQIDLKSSTSFGDFCLSDKSDFNKDAEEQALQKMNKRLSYMGEVNLLALKEYEELVEDNNFYQKQYEDLCSSKEKLSQVIKRIDSFCSKKFKEVFEQVNSCFSKVWPSLFEGGKAELILVKDPEKGVEDMEIIVQPPGKKIQNMNLLSGGEKAMTAVAVIFSIFLVKPSPFCILDEVDASLDDANIARFNSLLAEMAAVSQIIIITHNKYTMRECSYLYGVTMEEKGISKVMSLDMEAVASHQSKVTESLL